MLRRSCWSAVVVALAAAVRYAKVNKGGFGSRQGRAIQLLNDAAAATQLKQLIPEGKRVRSKKKCLPDFTQAFSPQDMHFIQSA